MTQSQMDVIDAVSDIKNIDRNEMVKNIIGVYCLNVIRNTPEVTHLTSQVFNLFDKDFVSIKH